VHDRAGVVRLDVAVVAERAVDQRGLDAVVLKPPPTTEDSGVPPCARAYSIKIRPAE